MPTYVYACDSCEHEFEEIQKMSDDPLLKCPKCKKKKLYRVPQVPLSTSVKKTASDWKTIGDLADFNRDNMTEEQIEAATPQWRKQWQEDKKIMGLSPKEQKRFIETGYIPTPSDKHSLGMVSLTGKSKREKKERKPKKK